MKNIALVLLVIGVALCASYGSRLSPEMAELMVKRGAAKFTGGAEKTAKGAYCAARKDAGLPEGECGEDGAAAVPDTLGAEVEKLRDAWQTAAAAAAGPREAAASAEVPGPGVRLNSWLSQSGGVFFFGLLLVIAGAVLGRIAVKREAAAEPTGSKGAGEAVDFGHVLEQLVQDADGLFEQMKGGSGTTEELDSAKAKIEAMQGDRILLLLDARMRVQVKYGMAGYAEVFGPFSAGERKLARTWSAIADQHWPEALTSVEGAAEALRTAHEVLGGLSKAA